MGTGDVTLGGTAGQRTVTVTAGSLAVGSIPVATTGYGLTKAGAGTLSLTGALNNNIDGTLNITGGTFEVASDTTVTGLTGSGTIQPYLTANKWFFVNNATDNIFSGVIQAGAGFLGLNKGGAGTLTLTGSNTYNLATTVRQGTLVFSGTTDNTLQTDNIGITAGLNGVLVLSPGSTFGANNDPGNIWNSSINIGTTATGAGICGWWPEVHSMLRNNWQWVITRSAHTGPLRKQVVHPLSEASSRWGLAVPTA